MNELKDSMRQLDVTLYGNNQPISPTLSKCRVRIFYKGLNRNRTYISEDFANQLIKSLPYTPVKGIFNKEDVDFEDHGYGHEIGQIYGIVPENPNFAWENHVDADGVERTYACADVILYTALYPEAKLIHEKSQSMEIHNVGLSGEWKIWADDGEPYFDFYTGHLLGLQALGDNVEPCFEGSAFFSLYKEAKELFDYVRNFTKKEEGEQVIKNVFNLEDESTVNALYDIINSENNNNIICDINDSYATIYNIESKSYLRMSYSKNENDEIVAGESTACYMINVTENDNVALCELKTIGTFAEIQAKMQEQGAQIAEFEKIRSGLELQLSEKEEALNEYKKTESTAETSEPAEETPETKVESTVDYEKLISEKDAEIFRLQKENSDLISEKSELEAYKASVDTEKKSAIIKEFSSYLSEEQIEKYNNDMDKFSIDDFKKEICYAAYNSGAAMLSPESGTEPDLIYKNTEKNTLTGALKLLNKYKGGNK